MFYHVLVLRPGPFSRLDSALATGPPDASGMVTLYKPVPWPDGPAANVPATMCYQFDRELMHSVNRMANESSDSCEAATNELIMRSEMAFTGAAAMAPLVTH